MAYNTGNPVGSTSPKDLQDNARNTDFLAIGPAHVYVDRRGEPRKSWRGMEDDFESGQTVRVETFNAFMDSSGYESPVPYAPGLILERSTQTVTYNGKDYRAKSEFIPLTTTNWEADEKKLKLIGDDSLRQDVGSWTNPSLGAGMVGMDGRWLRDYLKQQEYFLTIEYFGPTDTPANTKITMQKAINFCAANGILLRGKASSYTIDVSDSGVLIPDNFWCDLGGAWIKRATGNKTPHDMWVNVNKIDGNTGLNIQGVYFNGRAQADNLTNEVVEHRFCGLRLIKCEGTLINVRADSTCNGEIQDEGTRGAIMLENSVFMECQSIRTDNNIGTGLFIYGGSGRLSVFHAYNNTGSGVSGKHSGWWLNDLRSIKSGYSGISLNGAGFVANKLYATGAAVGFAGINFGHVGSEATDAMVSDAVAENNSGWGINCTGAVRLKGRRWRSANNGAHNLRVTYSPGLDVEIESVGGNDGVIIRESIGTHYLSLRGSRNRFTILGEGAEAIFTPDSIVQDCAADVSGIQADPGAKITYPGVLRNNAGWGATANTGSISLAGALVAGNGTPWRGLSGGVITVRSVVLDEYAPTNGTITIPARVASVTVPTRNAITQSRITIAPLNSAARSIGIPAVTAMVMGESFTVTTSGTGHTVDLIYTYALL